jgi:hypothetical protein
MAPHLEYYVSVRDSISATVALFGLLAMPLISAPASHAQVNGASAAAAASAMAGHGTGPNSFAPNHSAPKTPPANGSESRRPVYLEYAAPVFYAVPVPYAVDSSAAGGTGDDNVDPNADDDANYQGGPTVFDVRGSGADDYVPPVRDIPAPHAVRSNDPGPSQPPTVLVFKDGHSLEVENYAIVGVTLFDLTPGHTRKVALADLDLEATQKKNDDRGVPFQIPSTPQGN